MNQHKIIELKEDLILKEQSSWHSRALQGCVYAAHISRNNPIDVGFERVCLNVPISDNLITTLIKALNNKILDPGNGIYSIVIPAVKEKSDLLLFIELCKKYSNWLIDDNDIVQDYKQVKMKVPLATASLNSAQIYSWVLGFGNFPFFPKTRQSPFFEIMIPTKSKQHLQKKFSRFSLTRQTNSSRDRGGTPFEAHLADVYVKGVTDNQGVDEKFWESSIQRKNNLLSNTESESNTDPNAKAKITLSYPL